MSANGDNNLSGFVFTICSLIYTNQILLAYLKTTVELVVILFFPVVV